MMGPPVRLRLGVTGLIGPSVQRFLPDFQLLRIAVDSLIPEAKQLKGTRCCRILQKTFLSPMAETAGEAIATDQHFSRLVAQTVGKTEVCAVGC